MGSSLSDFADFPLVLKRLTSFETPMQARIVRISDGDTAVVYLNRKFMDRSIKRLRLRGINAEELGTPTGDAAAKFLTGLLPAGTPVVVTTYKQTYDRYECRLMFLKDGIATDIADELVNAGHAVRVT